MHLLANFSVEMRLIVSVVPVGVLITLAPAVAYGMRASFSQHREERKRQQQIAKNSSEFNFSDASMGERVVFLANIDAFQAAIEHFHAFARAEQDRADVLSAYRSAMQEFVGVAVPTTMLNVAAYIDGFTDVKKVRTLWSMGDLDGVISTYEASTETSSRSEATAAYFDAKLQKARASEGLA